MQRNGINFIQKTGAQVIIIRGDDQAAVYYPTPLSLIRLARAVRLRCPGRATCLPFSDGWAACLNPSYHEAASPKLNISGGGQ